MKIVFSELRKPRKEDLQMKEEEKKKRMEDGEGANKRDFLKVLGAGLGIAGIG